MTRLEADPAPGRRDDLRVVGIGASAGGLESLELLFAALPATPGMAFVIVQHLSPDFRSLMPELISRHTAMPAVVAESGIEVEPDHIYLMPPGKEMIIRDRRLALTDKEPHTFSLPIDAFFRSLAQDLGAHAVAVVLSGTGTDGSRGVVDVHRAGGIVVAEPASSAKFDGMPMAAVASGVVDHVLAPGDLARVLCGLPPLAPAPEAVPMSDDPALDAVLRHLRDGFGIDFTLYKTGTVSRRLQRRLDVLRVDLHEYAELIAHDSDELDRLYQDLLIGVTGFFRDREAFELLENEVVPKLLDDLGRDDELRVWIAGCATGEEAYSIAMLLFERYQARERPLRMKILATDVHQRSLDFASAGIYGEDALANVSEARLARFFTRRSTGYQVSQDLRQLIVFARHNLLKDAPFTKMHMISCRNMLIYLQPPAERTVMSLFHFGLAPQGILFLGASESPTVIGDELAVVDDRWKVFRKRRDVHLLDGVRLPALQPHSAKPRIALRTRPTGPDPLILAAYDQLLDLFMPPGFLVDDSGVLLESFSGAEQMLRLRRRRPTTNLLELLDDDLRVVVAGAIRRAQHDRAAVSYPGVRVVTADGELRATVVAQPIVHPRTNARHVLVTFRDMTTRPRVDDKPIEVSATDASRERMSNLESELAFARENLQATVEELETSNEEMQATNEELVASNEELQSTNEELHTVNEELYTVNAEYQQKIAELKQLNADMSHLLEGTDVGTVFLDNELRIRRFTSGIARVFRFLPADVGREIGDFSHNIQRSQLLDEIASTLREGTPVEDEVRDRAGTPYFLRILPYSVGKTDDTSIFGVVLTLTDISALDRARTRVDQLSTIVESSDDAIFAMGFDAVILTWNGGAERVYGYSAEEAIGKNAMMLVQPQSAHELARLLHELQQGHTVEHVSSLNTRSDGERIDVLATLSPIRQDGQVVAVSAIGRDVSPLLAGQRELEAEQHKVRQLLEQAEDATRMRERFLAMLSHELRNPLAAVMNAVTVLREVSSAKVAAHSGAVIERQARQMKRLLDDILDVSRITSGKFVVDRKPIDLRDALDTAIETTAPLFAERAIVLDRVPIETTMPVVGDAGRLCQVFANLLSNAAVHSPENSRVWIAVTVEDPQVIVRVRDRGDGIDPSLQPRIFDLFVQGEQQLDRRRGGLGVGLSLAKTIVDLHGGAIAVHSDGMGKGSEFTVTLPLGDSVRAAAGTRNGNGRPRRIVLVDDQEDSRSLLKVLFEARDHVVFDAADGPEGIALIEAHRPDVAFIDIGLPKMNGFEVAQHIRKRRDLDSVVLVALTGYGGNADIEAASQAGFDEHVTKPAELQRLEQILEGKRRMVERV